jgi:hypothetical protein
MRHYLHYIRQQLHHQKAVSDKISGHCQHTQTGMKTVIYQNAVPSLDIFYQDRNVRWYTP